ncbi:Ldh family oxidoreductase [Salinarimonas rosea]|uniref:Ldh family oxidoreductase n=1 Tax=Salinarimonas rosea TaxID=552063 RepID=UPI000415BD32|nr:Ldh family oxidoreductase [Salinarimonas rosea]
MNAPDDRIRLSLDEVLALCHEVLRAAGLSPEQTESVARVVWAAQRDECQSHGVWRLLGCVRTIRSGKLDADARPEVFDHSPAIVRVDAKRAFSNLAFDRGLPLLVSKARSVGIAAMAINNCFHFAALWPEVEALAEQGLAAIAMSPSHSWVAPAGGAKPVFGTNPFAFAWPRPSGEPFVFDFATSVVARGEIQLAERNGQPIPEGWALDHAGHPTTDPSAALEGAMLTFGGHKGSALSAMIELMAGPLVGDLMSSESMAFDGGAGAAPFHGELVVAFDPRTFLGGSVDDHLARTEALFERIVDSGARLPSQRRFEARARSEREGVLVPRSLYAELDALRAGEIGR